MRNRWNHNIAAAALSLALGAVFASAALAQEVLPRPPQPFGGKIDRTFKDSTPDWAPVQPAMPPANAPNIVVIVLDDVGYGQLGSYGGSIQTPNIDRLAAGHSGQGRHPHPVPSSHGYHADIAGSGGHPHALVGQRRRPDPAGRREHGLQLRRRQGAVPQSVQYFEMFGSRALWSQGWMATVWHKKGDSFDGDQWELYNLDEDFSQANNFAQKHPDKLKALQELWWAEAGKYGVLPLDDRRWERLADTTRPKASLPKDSYTYYPGTSPVSVVAAPRVLNRSHRITAEVEIPASGAEGVLLCLGTEFGGWSLFVKDEKLVYAHNYLQIQEFNLRSTTDVPTGKATLTYEFTKTGENVGTGRLFINGKPAGELQSIKTAPIDYAAASEGLQVGRGWSTPVSHGYDGPFAFTGRLDKVVLDVQEK